MFITLLGHFLGLPDHFRTEERVTGERKKEVNSLSKSLFFHPPQPRYHLYVYFLLITVYLEGNTKDGQKIAFNDRLTGLLKKLEITKL